VSNTKLFEFAAEAVFGEGGDGDMTIVFQAQNHVAVANEFELWMKEKYPTATPLNRKDHPDRVDFWLNQESFMFTNSNAYLQWGYTQLVVTL